LLVTAAVLLGVIIAIGVQWAADRLAGGLSDKIEAISAGLAEVSEAVGGLAESIRSPHPTRTVASEPGTRVAYVFKTKNYSFEIGYAPVLAFVERNETYWGPLALIDGQPRICDCIIERVLLTGESLTEQECAEMKSRYADEYPVEVKFAAQQRGKNT
jgi:hypothetical protein